MSAPRGYENYKLPLLQLKSCKGLGNYTAFANYFATENPTCTPDLIFREYCGSSNCIMGSRAPAIVRNFTNALYKTVKSVKRAQVFEQARIAVQTVQDGIKTAVSKNSVTNSLKRSTYAAMAEFGDEYARSVKSARTNGPELAEEGRETEVERQEVIAEKEEEEEEEEGLDELDVLWEPEVPFIEKLRDTLKKLEKSKNTFDNQLSKEGIIRLSSRKEDEPSGKKDLVKKLTADEITQLKELLQVPGVDVSKDYSSLLAKTVLEMREKVENYKPSTSYPGRTIRALQDLFISGLEGKADLQESMQERTWTAKYIVPLFERVLGGMEHLKSFWCEKGDIDIVKSRDKEHHLWDGAFLDVTETQRPHVLLVEVSGGTEGTSKAKADADLLKLAHGMRRHLLRVGRCVRGTNISTCRKLRVVGVHIVANIMYFQAMTMMGQGVFVMWEWGRKKIPRSASDMWSFGSTLGSMYTLKRILMETKQIIEESKYEEAQTCELGHFTGLSSPLRDTDTPWEESLIQLR